MGKYSLLLMTILFSFRVLGQSSGIGEPPALPQDVKTFGNMLKWKHSLKDVDGNPKAPDGYILFYAPKRADLGGSNESQIGIIDPSQFVDPNDPSIFAYKLTTNDLLLSKRNCFQLGAYYTYDDNGSPIRVDSGRSNVLCKTVVGKPEVPLVLPAD